MKTLVQAGALGMALSFAAVAQADTPEQNQTRIIEERSSSTVTPSTTTGTAYEATAQQPGTASSCPPMPQPPAGTGGSGEVISSSYSKREVILPQEKKKNDTGPYVLIGGGVEGYVGDLAPAVNPGASYGATIGVRPLRNIGFELGFSGAINEVDLGRVAGDDGMDIVRNGGTGAVVLHAGSYRVDPYLMGGFGVEQYNVRNGRDYGFKDDWNTLVPAGVGVGFQLAEKVRADVRGTYNFLIADQFSPVATDEWDGRYQGVVTIGGNF
jgi:opacity protein-like surface antigen